MAEMKKPLQLSPFTLILLLVLSSFLPSAVAATFEVTGTLFLENPGGYYGLAYDSADGEDT
jgi:hypothetical protein